MWIKRLERSADRLPPPGAGVAYGLELNFRLPSVPEQACHGVTFAFTLHLLYGIYIYTYNLDMTYGGVTYE
jgi:hypothetical protein